MYLIGVSQRVQDALKVTRVEQFFNFYDSLAAVERQQHKIQKLMAARKPPLSPDYGEWFYAALTFSACHPLGPLTTSN